MKKIIAVTLFVCASLVLTEGAYAQKFTKRKRYLAVGATLGAANYFGDLAPLQTFASPSIMSTGIHLGLAGYYRWKPKVSFRVAFAYNLLRGADANSGESGDAAFRKIRNLSFFNNTVELKGDIVYDFVGNRGTFLKRPDYIPYVFLGISIFYQSPFTTNAAGKWVNLRTYNGGKNSEGIATMPIQVAIPLGVGFRKKLNKEWDFAFEIGWRMTFTDYLDDVSSTYSSPSSDSFVRGLQTRSYGADIVALAQKVGIGTHTEIINGVSTQVVNGYGDNAQGPDKRGTSTLNDWYIVTNFHLTKILKGGVRCPKFR